MSEAHSELYQSNAESVSDEERGILAQHEPLVQFSVVGDREANLSQGRQSRVSVLEYEQGGETQRILWKRMGATKGLDSSEANALNERLQPYRRSLVEAGWQVPKILYSQVAPVAGEHQIFSYEQHIPGGDGEKMLADPATPNFRKWHLINEVINQMASYASDTLPRTELAGQSLTALPHGLDLKLANVVLEEGSDELYFVDLFGPKELASDGNRQSYNAKLDTLSPESLRAVCATREGAILRCWRLAENYWSLGGAEPTQLQAGFLERINKSPIPPTEQAFITREVEAGYEWLDRVYQETAV